MKLIKTDKHNTITQYDTPTFDDVKDIILSQHDDPSYIYQKDNKLAIYNGDVYMMTEDNGRVIDFEPEFIDEIKYNANTKPITINVTTVTQDLDENMDLVDVTLQDDYVYKSMAGARHHMLQQNKSGAFTLEDDKTIVNGENTYKIMDDDVKFTMSDIYDLSVRQSEMRFAGKDVTMVEYGNDKQYFNIRKHQTIHYTTVEDMTKTWKNPIITPIIKNGKLLEPAYDMIYDLGNIPTLSGRPTHKLDTSLINRQDTSLVSKQENEFIEAIKELMPEDELQAAAFIDVLQYRL